MNIRKNDIVQIMTGDDAGNTGRVLRVIPTTSKVLVEGVNRVYRHMKPSQRNAQGGRLSKEMPVALANVQLFCATCRRGVRVGRRYAADGHKERYCKKCGNGLGDLSKPRKKYAAK